MGAQQNVSGPDFAAGVPLAQIPDGGVLAGRVGEEPLLVSRRGESFFAVSGACTHYGGPLAEGLVTGDRVRCPWHHACFDLRTGEAVAAPAFAPLARWRVDVENDAVFVRERAPDAKPGRRGGKHPARVLIIGGGAAGFAAADALRRMGYSGDLTMLSADSTPPCDRPNLSKDYLAGTAPEEWIPLKDESYYRDNRIDLRLGCEAAVLDPRANTVATRSGETFAFDTLLLATGASPIRLTGFDHPNVHVLRTLSDSRAIIAAAQNAKRAAIVGAGFIGLEAAASLRTRGLEVSVVAPESAPLERVLGAEIAAFIRSAHETNGVRFHLGQTAQAFDGRKLRTSNGAEIEVDLVILGVGVRPNTQLASAAGLAVENGVVVDARMRTSAPHVFAAGDIASFPDARFGARQRVEHWVAAQRQGQVAAANMLGEDTRLADAPFFWSHHYEHSIRVVGHAAAWDRLEFDGSPQSGAFAARYYRGSRLLAAACLNRDRDALVIHEQLNAEMD